MKGTCPICDNQFNFQDDLEVSEIITCQECGSRLVVVSLEKNKVDLEEAPQVEEDWGE
ncbi:MAG: hypothetical protein KatS3mg092_0308 [Patescibacteria group bacterium]|nr:MAG: hypothetical protein KatS3mg092_0308 [Patescibacteria group bacterium]